jgi:hypothetical protein
MMEFAAGVLDEKRRQYPRLEELDSADVDGAPVWLVTLSFEQPKRVVSGMVLPSFSERDYKTFTVNKETGEVLSMKIRELAGHNA